MKKIVLVTAALLYSTTLFAAEKNAKVSNMGNVKGGDNAGAAHAIIDKKCTRCHSGKIIDVALKEKKDMFKIQKEMEKKGAKLNSKEREVLGIFWKEKNPLK